VDKRHKHQKNYSKEPPLALDVFEGEGVDFWPFFLGFVPLSKAWVGGAPLRWARTSESLKI
jgi:hypothetical protein